MKSNLFLKICLVFMVFSHLFCTEHSEKNSSSPNSRDASTVSKPSAIIDSIHSNNFATAQIAFNIETASGNILAYANLDLFAPVNDTGKFKVKKLLIDDGEKGPFSNFAIVDKAVITKNNQIKVMVTYELQTQRIVWETEKGQLTGVYGETPFKESVKSGGGSLSCTATIIFDDKTMKLLSQTSAINERLSINSNNNKSDYKDWNEFALKYLKVQLATTVSWTNPECLAAQTPCTTGVVLEKK